MAKVKDQTVSDKLSTLSQLQSLHSKIDQIQVMKGELPIEVSDLEDEIAGLETRSNKMIVDVENAKEEIAVKRNAIKDAQALIIKYDKQLQNVKNNREFDALSKEIEIQKLDIQLSEKRIKEAEFSIASAETASNDTKAKLEAKKKNLEAKKGELDKIISDTEKEEAKISVKIEDVEAKIEERLLTAYKRIRKSYSNGLAVVSVIRDSCGGCFGRIPPQTQSEIRTRKRIHTCEHCGRILADVDETSTGMVSLEYNDVVE